MSIESIKARAAAATPGPWEVYEARSRGPTGAIVHWEVVGGDYSPVPIVAGVPHSEAASTFIVHARTDIDLLLAVAEAAKEYAASWGVGPDCDISRASIGDWRLRCERARSAMFAALDALEAAA